MKKEVVLLMFILLNTVYLYGQAPFTTLCIEQRLVKSVDDDKSTEDEPQRFLKAKDGVQTDTTKANKEVGFFKNNGLTINLLEEGDKRMSVASQVLYYKLYLSDPVDTSSLKKRIQLPLMVIAKVSTNYDSVSIANSIDALDYEASPITIRVMPSFSIPINGLKNVLLAGAYLDGRALNMQNHGGDGYKTELIFSSGFGLTYQGYAEAGIYNKSGELSEKGTFSISAMLQYAKGQDDVMARLFNSNSGEAWAFQSFLMFRGKEESKFNMKIGYQHFFQRTISGTKNNFTLSLGM